jgi:hypothetical protein
LVKTIFDHPFLGPELACGISEVSANIRNTGCLHLDTKIQWVFCHETCIERDPSSMVREQKRVATSYETNSRTPHLARASVK